MQTDHFEHVTGLIDVLIEQPATLDEARTAIRDVVGGLLADRTDDPMVTVYVDRPSDEPDATRHDVESALSALESEFDIMHFVVNVDDRPLLGHPVTAGSVPTDPRILAVQRACTRVASALMHEHDLSMQERMQAATNCNAAAQQIDDLDSLEWAAQQIGEVGWQIGSHPIVAAARRFEGRPAAGDDEQPMDELTQDNLLARCVELAESLNAGDGAIETAMQSFDADHASLAYPSASEPPASTDQLLGVASSLASRVESAFMQEAEHGLDDYTDALFVPRETDPLQYIGNVGARLRAAVSELKPTHHATVASKRVSLALDGLALTVMTVDPNEAEDPLTRTMLCGALDAVLRESSIALGMMDAHSTSAKPLDLPYWPFVMNRASKTDVTVDLTVLGTIVEHATQLASTGDIPADLLDLVEGWRAHLAELKGNPAAADRAGLADGLIDAILLKLALRAGEEDTTRYMSLARQGKLSTDPEAIAAVKRLATSDSTTDGASRETRPDTAEPTDAVIMAVGLAATVLGNQLAYLRDEGKAGMPSTLTVKDGTAHMGYLMAENSDDALRMFSADLGKGETASAAGTDTYLRLVDEDVRVDAICAVGATPEGTCVHVAVPYESTNGTVTFSRPAQLVQASAGLTPERVREIVLPKLAEFGVTELREARTANAASKASKTSTESSPMQALFEQLMGIAGDSEPADLSMCDPETVETARAGAVAAFIEVAAADGNVDDSEVQTFLRFLSETRDPLIRTLFPVDVDVFQNHLASLGKYRDRLLTLKALGAVFEAHPDGARARGALVEMLKQVALADGTVDERELRTLSRLDDMFSGQAVVDFDRMVKRFWLAVAVFIVFVVVSIVLCGAWLFS